MISVAPKFRHELCSMGENKSYCKREKSKFAVFYLFFKNFVWKSAHFCIH